MKNDGKEAERAFEAHWNTVGHLQRFRDKKDLTGLNKGARLADFTKPADYVVSSRLKPMHYAEVKSTTEAHRFDFGKIQPAQSSAALQEAKKGHSAYIFYIFSYPLGQWFYMTCVEYADYREAGRKSVTFEELRPWVR